MAYNTNRQGMCEGRSHLHHVSEIMENQLFRRSIDAPIRFVARDYFSNEEHKLYFEFHKKEFDLYLNELFFWEDLQNEQTEKIPIAVSQAFQALLKARAHQLNWKGTHFRVIPEPQSLDNLTAQLRETIDARSTLESLLKYNELTQQYTSYLKHGLEGLAEQTRQQLHQVRIHELINPFNILETLLELKRQCMYDVNNEDTWPALVRHLTSPSTDVLLDLAIDPDETLSSGIELERTSTPNEEAPPPSKRRMLTRTAKRTAEDPRSNQLQ